MDWRITMHGQHATMVSPAQERAILGYLATTRSGPVRTNVSCAANY